MCIHHLAEYNICTFADKKFKICVLHLQYTNVHCPKPTYYFYHAICYIKCEHKTVLRER